MAAYAKMSGKIKRGEYDDEAGRGQTGVLRFFNAIDGYMEIRALTNQQRDALWQEYFRRQTGRVVRLRARQPGR
jgi:hypothetical protein